MKGFLKMDKDKGNQKKITQISNETFESIMAIVEDIANQRLYKQEIQEFIEEITSGINTIKTQVYGRTYELVYEEPDETKRKKGTEFLEHKLTGFLYKDEKGNVEPSNLNRFRYSYFKLCKKFSQRKKKRIKSKKKK
jgi:uncharacterized membrane protein YcgQ (UPF0703/DUF1980 family)